MKISHRFNLGFNYGPKLTMMALMLTTCTGLAGCVERSITLVTSPQHAVVYLNDVEVGRSPCKVPFEWYGDYSVRIRARKNLGTAANPHWVYYYFHTNRTAHAPWFQWIGPDLFAALLPIHFKDDKIWAFVVPPAGTQSSQQLIENAKKLQAQLPPVPGSLRTKKVAPAR